MTEKNKSPLLIGEIIVDVTITSSGSENKMRLGGITHAARAFKALDQQFSVGAILPSYLENDAREYFEALGCQDFKVIGYISGAPNIMLIFDQLEVGDQGYEALLRDKKNVSLTSNLQQDNFSDFNNILVFPGDYNLKDVVSILPEKALYYIDIAYDIKDIKQLFDLERKIDTVFLSTSSELFSTLNFPDLVNLANHFTKLDLSGVILKENRGGSQIFDYSKNVVERVPAQLGTTINSVGVGDTYAAAYLFYRKNGIIEATWRAMSVASAYSQTTEPDLFQKYVQRAKKLSVDDLKEMGGTLLSWEKRKNIHIYIAAPDFERVDRRPIEYAVSSLKYHNFKVRRPVQENGELPLNSDNSVIDMMYYKDLQLLKECQAVFAIPLQKDPGTLVEIGLAIELGIPVIVYDPFNECPNTMVIGGSVCYSNNMDECINALFTALSE